MIISIRLNEEDTLHLQELKDYLDKRWQEIFIDDPTTNSEAIRACIRYTYEKIIESNKSDS